MTRKNKDDKKLFRDAMRDVRPMESNEKVQHGKKRPSTRPLFKQKDEQQVIQDMLSEPIDLAEIETGDELFFAREGLQYKVLKRLRRGELSMQAELDLHRMTKVQAREAVVYFLQQCRQQGLRQIRIVHGKGHGSPGKIPVLKTLINHWLKQRDDVLAFCSARPVDGGTGAIYVILRKY